MDFLKQAAETLADNKSSTNNNQNTASSNNKLADGLLSAVNGALGGGKQAEQKEGELMPGLTVDALLLTTIPCVDLLDKGELCMLFASGRVINHAIAIDLFQEKVLKEGPQNNESALEQAKDKMIADTIKNGYKNVTGKNFPTL